MSVLNGLSDLIWNEKLWFPNKFAGQHYGWRDIENQPNSDLYYPQFSDIHWGFLLGLFLVVFRYILSRIIFIPLGKLLGITNHQHQSASPFLDATFEEEPNSNTIFKKKTDISLSNGELTSSKSQAHDHRTPMYKFCKSGWQLLYYTSMVIFGFAIQWDKPWIRDPTKCFEGWPKQEVSRGMYWYYTIQLAFYWNLLFTLLSDVKQVHFMENVIHHSAALILIYISWTSNFVRFGALMAIIHDVSDPFLESAKLLTYLEKKRAADVTFMVFIILWIIGELIVLLFYVLYVFTFVYFDYSDGITLPYCVMNLFSYLEFVLVLMWTCHMYKWIRVNITKMTKKSY